MTDKTPSESAKFPSLFALLIRPQSALAPWAQAEHIPLNALWSVISAAGIIFYVMLPMYPRADFEFSDFLASLALLAPFVGLIVLRLAAFILSKAGGFFGGKANTRICHGALSVGLLPVGVSLIISLPIFLLHPDGNLDSMKPFIGITQTVTTFWSLANTVKSVALIHQLSQLHAAVSLLGMIGFLYAAFNVLGMVV